MFASPFARRAVFLGGFLGPAAILTATLAAAQGAEGIPALASSGFGWQSNVADWQAPPPGTPGHGPIGQDPAHPFTSNAEANRLGIPPTLRIGDAKDPVLKLRAGLAQT